MAVTEAAGADRMRYSLVIVVKFDEPPVVEFDGAAGGVGIRSQSTQPR